MELGTLDSYSKNNSLDNRLTADQEELEDEDGERLVGGGSGDCDVDIGSPARKKGRSTVISSLDRVVPANNYASWSSHYYSQGRRMGVRGNADTIHG